MSVLNFCDKLFIIFSQTLLTNDNYYCNFATQQTTTFMKQTTFYRNQDLLSVARQIYVMAATRGRIMNISELIKATLSRQPKMHYVDFDTASAKLHAIDRHGLEAVVHTAEGRAQWSELRDQVAAAMAARRRLTFAQALTFVLHFRRPSRFYIAPNTAYKILCDNFRIGLIEFSAKRS